jgi:hypothetical protein
MADESLNTPRLDERLLRVLGLSADAQVPVVAAAVAGAMGLYAPTGTAAERLVLEVAAAAALLYSRPARAWENSEVSNFIVERTAKGWSARELDQAGRELGLTVGELEPALWEGAARLASRMAQEAPFSVQ